MIYSVKFAWRYLSSNKLQTALLVLGVAVGVFVFVFISALIGGLGSFLVDRTVGNISHITVEAPRRAPVNLMAQDDPSIQLVTQRVSGQRDILRTADAFLPSLETLPGVAAISPQIRK